MSTSSVRQSCRSLQHRARAPTRQSRNTTIRAEKDWAKEAGNVVLREKQLPAERYIATNRFQVKSNAGAAFEKRWTVRKSRLATLEGFRFFTLMRRVGRTATEEPPADEPNYVSFTVWEEKDNFDSWYTGEAFKEAHGGGTIWGFVDMLVNATFTLNGAPKPSFWQGILPVTVPGDMSGKRVEAGWRVIEADGKNKLPAECFIVSNRFKVVPGGEEAFEERWAKRESKLKEMDGFKSFFICRRDALKADDGFNYQSVTVWRDRAAFVNWAQSSQFAQAHAQAKPSDASQPSTMDGPPSAAFYEGILVLETERGA